MAARRVVRWWDDAMMPWRVGEQRPGDGSRPLVMGILNATPDSFSDGGRYDRLELLLDRADQLAAEGADILDLGGESTRPGARPIDPAVELDRVLPALERLVGRVRVPISVDTSKPEVARAAVTCGARIINDVTGLRNPAMRDALAGSSVGVVIMHMQGTPATMQLAPTYDDVVAEVRDELQGLVANAVAAGIARERIAIDPGIGFGKTFDHNLALLRHLRAFETIGCPLLVGTSRKGFLGTITGRPIAERQAASVASALAAAVGGASIVRVHDVAATVDALKVWDAQVGWSTSR